MADTGWVLPTSATTVAYGTKTWTNPSYITAKDGSFATATTNKYSSGISYYLVGYSFGFTIPAHAVITGVSAEIRRKGSVLSAYVVDYVVSLGIVGSGVMGNNYADANNWPFSASDKTYGGSGDLWGCTLTPATVNNSNFGLYLSVYLYADAYASTASVDSFRMTVYYTFNSVNGVSEGDASSISGVSTSYISNMNGA